MVNDKKVGIGITTYNRPDFFKQTLESVLKNIKSVDHIWIYNDGSSVDYSKVYREVITGISKITVVHNKQNHGVAFAKNTLLKDMLAAGCDYLFLLEDDILLLDDKAVTEYIRVGEDYGYDHFSFAHHGPANQPFDVVGQHYQDDEVAYWPHCIGAWCYYTKKSLLELEAIEKEQGLDFPGFFDENFYNAWEHVEHTVRLGNHSYTGWFGLFADLTHSRDWIKEQEGAIANSSIRPDDKWRENMKKGLTYWKEKHGSSFPGEDQIVINTEADREKEISKAA